MGIFLTEKVQVYLILSITSIFILASFIFQHTIEYNQGLGWDGAEYSLIYHHFDNSNVSFNEIAFPFNQRIGTPYLAHLLPFDKFTSFKIINLFSFFLGIVLLIKKWGINSLSALFILFIILTPQLPFRYTLFYPINVDGILFLYIILVIVFFKSPFWVFLFSIFFLPFKEASILICSVYFFSLSIYKILRNRNFNISEHIDITLYIVLPLIGLYIYRYYIQTYFGIKIGSSFRTLLMWIKIFLLDYKFYIRLAAVSFTVFGVFLFFYLRKLIINFKYSHSFNHFSIFIFILIGILIFTGSDTTRILCISLLFILNEILNLNITKSEAKALKISSIIAILLKFPLLILHFNDGMTIGEGMFITQPEYIHSLTLLFTYIIIGILSIFVFLYLNKKII